MSVLLNWENPEFTFLPSVRFVRVERGPTHFVVCLDAPWGIFEDVESVDPCETYTLFYCDAHHNEIGRVNDSDIRKFARPSNSCKLNFAFINADGSPGSNTKVRITNPRNTEFSRIVCANYSGLAEAFFIFGQRLLIEIAGLDHALDCIIPSIQETCWEDLIKNGSWVLAEKRGTAP